MAARLGLSRRQDDHLLLLTSLTSCEASDPLYLRNAKRLSSWGYDTLAKRVVIHLSFHRCMERGRRPTTTIGKRSCFWGVFFILGHTRSDFKRCRSLSKAAEKRHWDDEEETKRINATVFVVQKGSRYYIYCKGRNLRSSIASSVHALWNCA